MVPAMTIQGERRGKGGGKKFGEKIGKIFQLGLQHLGLAGGLVWLSCPRSSAAGLVTGLGGLCSDHIR